MKFYNHPDYDRRLPDWEKCRDLVKGDHDTLCQQRYLWPHEFEENGPKGGEKLRRIRELRTRYTAHLRTIINRYVSLIFKSEPDTSEVQALFGDEIENVDGHGTSLLNFVKNKLAPAYFEAGKCGIVTDSFDIDVTNMAEQQASNQRPFWELLDAMTIRDWRTVPVSASMISPVRWLRTQYSELEERESADVEPTAYQYSKLYSIEGGRYVIRLYKGGKVSGTFVKDAGEWEQVGTDITPEGITEVPIALVDHDSWITDLAEKALQLYNLESSLDNQLNFQAFQRIFATGFKSGDAVIMNEAGVTVLPEGFAITVVEPTQPTALMARINGVTATLFQLAFSKTRVLPSDAKEIESAENQREAKEDFLATLINASNTLEQLTNTAIRHYAAFKGQPDFDGKVSFSKDITIEDVAEMTNIVSTFYDDIKRVPLWYKETMKGIADRMNFADADEIKAAIDAAPMPQDQPEVQAGGRNELFAAAINA